MVSDIAVQIYFFLFLGFGLATHVFPLGMPLTDQRLDFYPSPVHVCDLESAIIVQGVSIFASHSASD